MLKYNKLKILKIFQYESKFQSMSVLVYDYEANKFYIFAKGAPEIIHINSINKYSYFDDLLKDISHSGYRSIAYGFK
jgi:magnesium-transporting ATPase (P-type)